MKKKLVVLSALCLVLPCFAMETESGSDEAKAAVARLTSGFHTSEVSTETLLARLIEEQKKTNELQKEANLLKQSEVCIKFLSNNKLSIVTIFEAPIAVRMFIKKYEIYTKKVNVFERDAHIVREVKSLKHSMESDDLDMMKAIYEVLVARHNSAEVIWKLARSLPAFIPSEEELATAEKGLKDFLEAIDVLRHIDTDYSVPPMSALTSGSVINNYITVPGQQQQTQQQSPQSTSTSSRGLAALFGKK